MLQPRLWGERGGGDFGWLKAKHHFAFADHGKPSHTPLGSLIVWNDDEIAPGTGFPLHGHANVEIITCVRQGTVAHRDNLGNVGRIEAGDVQVMSAGTGIQHAEFNPGHEPLRIYQIWIRSRESGGKPHWETRPFPKAGQSGRLVVLASGYREDENALSIRADAKVLGAVLAAGDTIIHSLAARRHAYLALAAGAVAVNGTHLHRGDGVAITDEAHLRSRHSNPPSWCWWSPHRSRSIEIDVIPQARETPVESTKYLPAIGRVLIGLPFLMSGAGKLAAYGATTAYIASVGLPLAPLGWAIAIIFEIGGGLCLLLGFRVRPVAVVLSGFTLAAAVLFHHNFADQNQMIHFLKDVMIAGGLLQIAHFGAGAYSLDARKSRNQATTVDATS